MRIIKEIQDQISGSCRMSGTLWASDSDTGGNTCFTKLQVKHWLAHGLCLENGVVLISQKTKSSVHSSSCPRYCLVVAHKQVKALLMRHDHF